MDIRINISGAEETRGERRGGSDNKTGTETQTQYLLDVHFIGCDDKVVN